MIKKVIIFILGLLFLNLLRINFIAEDLFKLLIVLVTYLIFIGSMSHIKCEKKSLFMDSFISIILISFLYFIVSLILGNVLFNSFKLLFLLMGLCIFIVPSLNVIKDCLSKKKGKLIRFSFVSVVILAIIISVLFYKLSNLDINIVGGIIYLSMYIVLIPTLILNRNLIKFNNIKFNNMKKVVSCDIKLSIVKLSNLFYYYLSLLFLYFSLTNVFMYYDKSVTKILIDVYLYYFYFVMFLVSLYNPKKINRNVNIILIDLLDEMLPKLILISVLSGPVTMIMFGNSYNAFIFGLFVFESFFIIMYNIIINKLIDKKIFNIIIVLGIVLKCILSVPLINLFYRIGFSMIYGNIISTIMSLLIVIVVGIIYINKNEKCSFVEYFKNMIKVLFVNAILFVILVLFMLIISVKATNIIHAIGIIIVYFVIYWFYENLIRKISDK